MAGKRRIRKSESIYSCENPKDYMEHYSLVNDKEIGSETNNPSSPTPPPEPFSEVIIPPSKVPLSPIDSFHLELLFGLSHSSLVDSLALEQHPKLIINDEEPFQEDPEPSVRRVHLHERPRNFPCPIIPPTPTFCERQLSPKNERRRMRMDELNFVRKTPEFVPRMMTEEFEKINQCIEKRKIDIRELLKRVEAAKHQHRRFSEHLQSAHYLTDRHRNNWL